MPEKAKHYGLTAKLDEPVDPAKGLVLQYEVKLSDGLTCGGAYLKCGSTNKVWQPPRAASVLLWSTTFCYTQHCTATFDHRGENMR